MFRKIMSSLLAVAMVAAMGTTVFADEGMTKESDIETPYVFDFANGTSVEYYLDENMNPYNTIDGERCYLPLPLPQLQVTDPDLLAAIKRDLPSNPELLESSPGASMFAAPPNAIDISANSSDLNSVSYNGWASFAGEAIVNTPTLKFNRSHSAIIFKRDSISAPIGSKGRINVVYSAYNIIDDTWSTYMFSGVTCSGTGMRISQSLSIYEYGKFMLNQYDDVNSISYSVKTTATW